MANNLYWRLLCHRDCRYSWSWNKHHNLMIHFSDDKACPASQLHQWKWAPASGMALSGSFKSLTLPLESLSISPLNFACLLQLENLCRPGSLTACQILQITFFCVFFFFLHAPTTTWVRRAARREWRGWNCIIKIPSLSVGGYQAAESYCYSHDLSSLWHPHCHLRSRNQ